jgi:hypothetical protein
VPLATAPHLALARLYSRTGRLSEALVGVEPTVADLQSAVGRAMGGAAAGAAGGVGGERARMRVSELPRSEGGRKRGPYSGQATPTER